MSDLDDELELATRRAVEAENKIGWSRKRRVPKTFALRLYAARYVNVLLPPVTHTNVTLWAFILGGAGLLWLWIWHVGVQVPGHSSVNTQVRLMADVSGALIYLLAILLPAAGGEDSQHRVRFRGRATERAAIIGYRYVVTTQGRQISIQLVAIRRVRRMLGVVAIQFPNGRYLFIPKAFFPSQPDWRKVQRQLSSN